jgi:peroxiredoxin Q/BCP
MAPEFALMDETGTQHRLSTYLARGPVVVYFYPRDHSLGCTVEACSFRDAYENFVDAGAEVIGISSDDPKSHAAFKSNHRLPFILLSDPGGEVARAYGVGKTLGIVPGRATFVLERTGRVLLAFSSQINAPGHVGRALEALGASERLR